MASDWSKLPLDPLGTIAMKFDVFDDLIRFAAVCQGWNRATSLVEHQWKAPLPSLLLAESTKENPNNLRKLVDLNSNQIYELKIPETFGTRCWGSTYGWVAMADEDRNAKLFNPITKAQIHFPSFKSLTHYHDEDEFDGCPINYMFLSIFLFKLVVLKVSRNGKHEFVIMVIYNNYRYVDFARQGDQSWTEVSTKEFKKDPTKHLLFTKIIDIVAKKDDIFALYADGSIVHWHAREFCSGKLLIPTDYSPPVTYEILSRPILGQLQKYLVLSHDNVFLVVRYKADLDSEVYYQTYAIDVFKLTEHNGWEKTENLGNVALFVGGNYSMSISLGVGQRLQHSGIYFTDDENEYWPFVSDFPGHDTGFYDMKRDKSQFFKYGDMRSLFCPSTWFSPKL